MLLLLSVKMTNDYCKLNKKTIIISNRYIISTILIYSVICGIRYDVGVDYLNYWNIYDDIYRFKWSQEINYQEPGWALFTKYLAQHGIHYSIYFTIIAFFQITLIIMSFRNYPKLLPYVIIAFYCCWFGVFQNILRQSITLAIFLYLALNINKIKIIQYIIVAILSITIHKSALIIILLYPILNKSYKLPKHPQILCLVYVILCVIGVSQDIFSLISSNPVLETILRLTQFDFYVTSNTLDKGIGDTVGIGYCLKIIVNIILILLSNRNLNSGSIKNIGILFYLFYIGMCISAIMPTSMLFSRPLLYFSILGLPIYSQVLFTCLQNRRKRNNISLSFLLIRNNMIFYLGIVLLICITSLFFVSNVFKPDGGNMEYQVYFLV